ncbi:hypothetical protein FACS189479_09600 [Spirochaetia bacterium]|nr:hypothetical protein FACS189479_09600 [Spirochaetia bacterium]
MKKRIIQIVVLGTLFALLPIGTTFAQEAAKKAGANAVSLDAAPLFKGFIASEQGKNGDKDTNVFGIGANYERLIAPHFSIGIGLDFYNLTYDKLVGTYFGMAVYCSSRTCRF